MLARQAQQLRVERRPILVVPRPKGLRSDKSGGGSEITIRPHEGAGLPEVTDRARRRIGRSPMRNLLTTDFKTEAPGTGITPPIPGDDASQRGKLRDARESRQRSADQRRARQFGTEKADIRGTGNSRMGWATRNIRGAHAERFEDLLTHPLGNTHSGRLREYLAENIETLVRVNATLLGSGNGAAPLKGQARGMGQKVTNRRPLGPRRIIQGEQAAVNRDQKRPGDDRLRHRGKRKDATNITV